jgi:hypothetical protein
MNKQTLTVPKYGSYRGWRDLLIHQTKKTKQKQKKIQAKPLKTQL